MNAPLPWMEGRGLQPWRPVGRVWAGTDPAPLAQEGTCVEIATGAVVPRGTETIIRKECAQHDSRGVTGTPRARLDWREAGEEAHSGERLLAAGSSVTPGVIGLAAACGHDTLRIRRAPPVAVLVLGDELTASGVPGPGRIRDALGPSLPSWLRRTGAATTHAAPAPVSDTLTAHLAAVEAALGEADIVCTTGGTMHGPADHLRPALEQLGGEYVVDTVAVRPGSPMLAARMPDGKFVCGLPGNPQAALAAMMTMVGPLLAGLTRRPQSTLRTVVTAEEMVGRAGFTRLAAVRLDGHGRAHLLGHSGSSMLRGVASADGFVVVPPGGVVGADRHLDFLPLPVHPAELPLIPHEEIPALAASPEHPLAAAHGTG